jgi:SAM-dependent methyltransferase
LAALRRLPDQSFDFIFSNGVLQSVRKAELLDTLRELRRLIHPDGCSVHSIDLRDTMGQSLHHLRFSERVWESDWFQSAGFYTNRLRLSEVAQICRRAGFEPEFAEVNRFPAIPVPRHKLAEPYRGASDEDLLVATIRVVLRPTGADREGVSDTGVTGEWVGSPDTVAGAANVGQTA